MRKLAIFSFSFAAAAAAYVYFLPPRWALYLAACLSLTGLSHVVSVSGMHVSLLFGVLLALCRRRRALTVLLSVPLLTFFAAMLGFTPSVTRAVVMNTIVLCAPLAGREEDQPTTLGFALLVILLI